MREVTWPSVTESHTVSLMIFTIAFCRTLVMLPEMKTHTHKFDLWFQKNWTCRSAAKNEKKKSARFVITPCTHLLPRYPLYSPPSMISPCTPLLPWPPPFTFLPRYPFTHRLPWTPPYIHLLPWSPPYIHLPPWPPPLNHLLPWTPDYSPPSRSAPQPVTQQFIPGGKTCELEGRHTGWTVLENSSGSFSSSTAMSLSKVIWL